MYAEQYGGGHWVVGQGLQQRARERPGCADQNGTRGFVANERFMHQLGFW